MAGTARQPATASSVGVGSGMKPGTDLPGSHRLFVSALAPSPKIGSRVLGGQPAAVGCGAGQSELGRGQREKG